MPPFIAGAILLGSVYQSGEASKAAKRAAALQRQALAQQASEAEAMRSELAKQSQSAAQTAASIGQQAESARMQYQLAQTQYAENKSALEKQAAQIQSEADAERRLAAQEAASRLRARTRGGRRALLSQQREDAELGVAPMLGGGMAV